MEIVSYIVGSQFAALECNGEIEGLTKSEIVGYQDLTATARNNAPEGYSFAHWSVTDDRDEFARCDVTDLMGECLRFDAVYLKD